MAKKQSEDFVVRYTNKDIMRKLDSIEERLEKVHHQASLTNGRVTKLEDRSIGVWISRNIFKFLMFVLLFFSIVISDIRHPLIDALTRLI